MRSNIGVFILFTALERNDSNKFISNIHNAVLSLARKGEKLSPKNISKESGYGMREIETNLYEIGQVIDALDL